MYYIYTIRVYVCIRTRAFGAFGAYVCTCVYVVYVCTCVRVFLFCWFEGRCGTPAVTSFCLRVRCGEIKFIP